MSSINFLHGRLHGKCVKQHEVRFIQKRIMLFTNDDNNFVMFHTMDVIKHRLYAFTQKCRAV